MAEPKRKGSRSIKDIPSKIMTQLNNGEIASANLVEWLAVNPRILLKNLLSQLGKDLYYTPIITDVDNLKKQTVNTINEAIGTGLMVQSFMDNNKELLKKISNHPSDTVRCWACYVVGRNEDLELKGTLKQIQIFAADTHFGVREIAWMAMRANISKNLAESIKILTTWTAHTDENIRRFASEATRPRGVWCEHIEELKKNPELALAILEPLRADPTKYVQDSVGNWLNDASKTNEKFVLEICNNWEKESKTKATDYIIKKALRTIRK
jgi:3-methyladenine DNA glycosylase AlkC